MKNFKLSITKLMIVLGITVWLAWDFSQATDYFISLYKSFKSVSHYDSISSATAKVSIVRSDDMELENPTPVTDSEISYQTIEDMVRRAIQLAGGFEWVIQEGDMVLLKPNIVDPEPPGSGEVTDVRVIKALIKIIDEISPGKIEIVIGEGSPREMDYELPFSSRTSPRWEKLWDVAGYQDLLTDPYLENINFRLSNLNGSPPESPWDDLILVDIPGGGEASPQQGQYYIHKDVLNADVFITVPVMKIHDPGITVSLKNQVGIAPSTRYGFSKNSGVPQDNYQTKLTHTAERPKYWTQKEIVDLCQLAQIKYSVVDAIACLELKKEAIRDGDDITNLVRMNMIVAGADPVAVDHVCTRLMGMNPDDIEHITLAEMVGLGTNNPENIEIVGADFEATKRPFKKSRSNQGDFGQGIRKWLLKGPYSIDGISDPIDYQFIDDEAAIVAKSGENQWSEAIYFTDDRLDLMDYYDLQSGDRVVSYNFCYFDAPKDQSAEFWIGSDEALKIYLNGTEIYRYAGTRSLSDKELVNTKFTADIKHGENRLLVKSLQKYGRYDFCLNICEPESDPDFDGNRVFGLKFKTESNATGMDNIKSQSALTYKINNMYPNPFNNKVQISYQVPEQGYINIEIYNINGQRVKTLFEGKNMTIGDHLVSWDGTNELGNVMASGTYIVTIKRNGSWITSNKILMIK
jgi:uncharacterized protein (DUF362 family)